MLLLMKNGSVLLTSKVLNTAITYRDLILAHTNSESKIIMDFRTASIKHQIQDITVLDYVEQSGKRSKIHFKFA